VSDADVERALTITLESTPKDATHWSTRSLAKQTGLSRSTVGRIWRAFALQPHRSETCKLSKDPRFIEKVRDIVGLYMDPPDRALVLCVDEKRQIQALNPHTTAVADASWPSVTPDSRLCAAWHDFVVCGSRREDRHGDRGIPPPAPQRGIP
jgi:hypothetical protein